MWGTRFCDHHVNWNFSWKNTQNPTTSETSAWGRQRIGLRNSSSWFWPWLEFAPWEFLDNLDIVSDFQTESWLSWSTKVPSSGQLQRGQRALCASHARGMRNGQAFVNSSSEGYDGIRMLSTTVASKSWENYEFQTMLHVVKSCLKCSLNLKIAQTSTIPKQFLKWRFKNRKRSSTTFQYVPSFFVTSFVSVGVRSYQ